MPVILILGGARSGKSRRAEEIATALEGEHIYIATAPHIEDDEEWTARIAHHRAERDPGWVVVEEERQLAEALQRHAGAGKVVLVDCLTLWLSNLLWAGTDIEVESARLCEQLGKAGGDIVLVSNEVGMGLVPESPEVRAFRDAQGRLNREVAAVADHVEFIVAGLPLVLKGENR